MLKYLLLITLFTAQLLSAKVLYLQYNKVPQRVIKGEVFSITLKTLSTVPNFKDIRYSFSQHPGVKILTTHPQRVQRGKYYLDTFYMLATSSHAKTPNITAKLVASTTYPTTTIRGKKLNVIQLNPPKDYTHLVAKSLQIVESKTTSFDNKHNIVVFVATVTYGYIPSFHFDNIFKQGLESKKGDFKHGRFTYFVVIDKKVDNFSLSYFNLDTNKFQTLHIPIHVVADRVTTQSDLKPQDHSHQMLKVGLALVILLIGGGLIIWKKHYFYAVFLILPLGYIIYVMMPDEEVCIKNGAKIQLLPVSNGTVFEVTHQELHLTKEKEVGNFIKVELQNGKIGWVAHEDICSN